MSSLVCKPKIKSNKARTKKPIQAEVVTFYNIVRKVAIAPKCLEDFLQTRVFFWKIAQN